MVGTRPSAVRSVRSLFCAAAAGGTAAFTARRICASTAAKCGHEPSPCRTARSWNQDAPRETASGWPTGTRSSAWGRRLPPGRTGAVVSAGFVVDFKFAQAQVGLGPELVAWKRVCRRL